MDGHTPLRRSAWRHIKKEKMTELLKRATENSNMDEKEEAFLRENIRKGNNKRGGKEILCNDIWFDFHMSSKIGFLSLREDAKWNAQS